jgi:PhoH-like ATPase
MKIVYIVDTSVIIFDPHCLTSLPKSEIIIHINVLNELDKIKTYSDKAGKHARMFIRLIDSLYPDSDGTKNIALETGSVVKIASFDEDPGSKGADNKLIECALSIKRTNKNKKAILLTRDINLRMRARAFNIIAKGYENEAKNIDEIHGGIKVIENEELGTQLENEESILCEDYDELKNLSPNEYVHFTDSKDNGISLGKRVDNYVVPIRDLTVWGLAPKNKEQACAIDLLMDPTVPLVSLIGKAGTGKTLLSVAAGLEAVAEKKRYSKMIVYRPMHPVGEELGYLPGDLEEKLDPWMSAVKDSFEFLTNKTKKRGRTTRDSWKDRLSQISDRIHLEAITYIRGRSIPNAYILIDECFPYEQMIETENGKEKIGKLYDLWKENKLLPLVKTFDEDKQIFEYKKIMNAWKRNKKTLIQIRCANRKIKCTKNHKFLTNNGWIKAKNLKCGDLLKTTPAVTHQILRSLNDDQKQIILGSFLGDAHISQHGINRYRIKEIHGIKQENYCRWKGNILGINNYKFIKQNGYSKKPAIRFLSKIFGFDKAFPKIKEECPQWLLDDLDERGLAIWYMDDGSKNPKYDYARLSTCSFNEESQKRIVAKLKSMGIECYYVYHKKYDYKNNGYYSINIPKSGCKVLFKIIAPYIHDDFLYKINNKYHNSIKYEWNKDFNNYGLTVVDDISNINEEKEVYDIEVEDNHNFIICSGYTCKSLGGIIAHNCQNTTKHEIKTILTRAGYNTKIILTGDIQQTDGKYLDATNNGLTHVAQTFKNSKLAGHITFIKGERSELATEAADLL